MTKGEKEAHDKARARHNREMKEIHDLIDRTDWARVREKLRAAALRNRRMSK
jgi:hypothetical protein